MVAVDFNPDLHYDTLCQWWKGHGWESPPVDFLGTAQAGVAIEGRQDFRAAGFLWYNKPDTFAVIDMLVTNPKNKASISAITLKRVMDHLTGLTKAKYIMTMCRQSSLADFLCMAGGFKKSDTNVTHLILAR